MLKASSPEAMYQLRELIRSRYEMDIKIWSLRNVRTPNRPSVEFYMDKADAIIEVILVIIEAWGDNSDKTWTDEEWAKVEVISKRIREGGYRTWKDYTPWN